jgi:hypothetical protein
MTRNALEILVVFSLINMVVFFSGVNCRFAMALPQMTIIDLTNSRNCLLLPCYDFSLTYSSYQMQPSKSPKVLKKQEFSIFMSVRLVNQSTVQKIVKRCTNVSIQSSSSRLNLPVIIKQTRKCKKGKQLDAHLKSKSS